MSNAFLPVAIEELLKQSQREEIFPNTRHLLIETEMIWLVGSPGGDVFAWEYDNEQFIPYYLQDMGPGDLIFGSTPEMKFKAQTFFFISSKPSILYKIPLKQFRDCLNHHQEVNIWFADKLEKWAGRLLSFFATSAIPSSVSEFALNDPTDLEPGQMARLQTPLTPEKKLRLSWVECISGSIKVAGNSTLVLNGPSSFFYPLSFFLWIEAEEKAKVIAYPTMDVLSKDKLWKSLAQFHQALFHFFEIEKEKELTQANERTEKKRINEAATDKESIFTLGSLLEKKLAYAPLQEGDSLFKACDLIGQVLKVKMIAPSHKLPTFDEQVQEIATLSGLYQRRISLKGEWWKVADFPLLAFYGADKKPVALINNSPTEFEFIDPQTLHREKVTAVNASHFDTTAYIFHIPFMEEKITFFKLMRFTFKDFFKESYILLIIAFFTGMINLYLPFAMKTLFESLTATANINLLMQLTIGLVLSAICLGFFTISKNFALQRLHGLSNNRLLLGLWGRVLNLPPSYFRKKSAGELLGEFNSIAAVTSTINEVLPAAVFSFIYTFLYFIQMLIFSLSLSFVVLFAIFVPLIIYAACISGMLNLFKTITDLSSNIQGFVIQLIGGLSKIRVAGAESRFFKIWSHLFSEKKRLYLRYQKLQSITQITHILFPLIATITIYAFTIAFFKKQKLGGTETLTTGDFVGFAAAFALFTSSALDVLDTIYSGLRIRPFWQSAQTLREQPLEKSLEKERAPPLKGKVVIDHASFRYNPEDDLTLQGVKIEAHAGEMIGIIGPSGSGKSTLVRLLLGFEIPESGAIYYDDKSLEDLDPRSIRSQIGTVLQNATLIAGSIYDNIVGSATYSEDAIEKAIRFSGFEDDLAALPMGLNTIIPMGGGSFSGGQKQRLLLARALVFSPKILILDEATSALDNKTQEFVTKHLNTLRVTRIVIAHRLSTIQNADRIYVIEKGQVVQVGTFKELSEQEGLFSSMLKRQSL